MLALAGNARSHDVNGELGRSIAAAVRTRFSG